MAKADAIDQLQYENAVLPRLLHAMQDAGRDRLQHGRIVKLFVERLAVRQAARELIGRALGSDQASAELAQEFTGQRTEHRRQLDELDEMTRGLAPTNVNQGQSVDDVVLEMAPGLLAEIRQDESERIPAVRRLLESGSRIKLPSASYVRRHCPLHPGAHPVRWYEHIAPLVWAHAVYDYLRSLPVGGIKPVRRVTIPGEGEVSPDSLG